MKLDLLAIAAHPDDVELTCGGTLIKMARRGYKTGILDLTAGEMGTRGDPARCQCQHYKIRDMEWRSVPVEERAERLHHFFLRKDSRSLGITFANTRSNR